MSVLALPALEAAVRSALDQTAPGDRESGGRAPGVLVALVPVRGSGVGVAVAGQAFALPGAHGAEVVSRLEALRPRWVWWSARAGAAALVAAGLHVRTCWDLAAVHRMLHGGSDDDPATVWAAVHGLAYASMPRTGQLDLLTVAAAVIPSRDGVPDGDDTAGPDPEGGDPEDPVRPDGHLRPQWCEPWFWTRAEPSGATSTRSQDEHRELQARRAARWAGVALIAQAGQQAALTRAGSSARTGQGAVVVAPALPELTAWVESATELMCVELGARGLPVDRADAESVVERFVGPRPLDEADGAAGRTRRDDAVRRHARRGAVGGGRDLRNPAVVRELLLGVGVDVADTRSWRLEPLREAHPFVAALLAWRRADRFATTYGYSWLDSHLGADGRLRGGWAGSDGGAGRMTATAGLHSLPTELRAAVRAEPGHVLVRADLGQVEPRVLAAVSGDQAFAVAARAEDLYSPVAAALGCDRATAKIAVLAAMYGQTSGVAGEALRGMQATYPLAMAFLQAADDAGRAGRDVRTVGGRLVRVGALPAGSGRAGARPGSGGAGSPDPPTAPPHDPERAHRAAIGARGRFARNAVVQGAAAELFKMWAVTVRAGLVPLDGHVVLCLHDELLLHVPERHAAAALRLVHDALQDTARRWSGEAATSAGRSTGADAAVRFVVDAGLVQRWSQSQA